MRLRIGLSAALVAAVLTTAAAEAALPGFPTRLVKPGVSLAGVEIGDAPDFAAGRWGAGECTDSPFDPYELPTRRCEFSGGVNGSAFYRAYGGRIQEVGFSSAFRPNGEPRLRGPLLRLRTRKGIGIGSSEGEVLRAYPKGNPEGGSVFLYGPGNRLTVFPLHFNTVTGVIIFRDV